MAFVAAGMLAPVSCKSPEGPRTPFGLYRLTAHISSTGDDSLPFMTNSGPSDSEYVAGGSLSLAPDSTFILVWQRYDCSGGTCGPTRSDTTRSFFIPVQDPAADYAMILEFPPLGNPEYAFIKGSRLVAGYLWAYERQQ